MTAVVTVVVVVVECFFKYRIEIQRVDKIHALIIGMSNYKSNNFI